MKKRIFVTHFTMKIIRTYLYIACNMKIVFVSSTYISMYILGAFGLLDFTMLRSGLTWRAV
jgi:hypothetical protein